MCCSNLQSVKTYNLYTLENYLSLANIKDGNLTDILPEVSVTHVCIHAGAASITFSVGKLIQKFVNYFKGNTD